MLITKSEGVTKQGFCKVLWRKLRLREGLLLSLIGVLWEGVGWGGRLFEAGRSLTFSAFGMGAYSRWALIRGWALNRINTVNTVYMTLVILAPHEILITINETAFTGHWSDDWLSDFCTHHGSYGFLERVVPTTIRSTGTTTTTSFPRFSPTRPW